MEKLYMWSNKLILYMNDKAVSPVIGVVLMVGLTVIVAATAGILILGVGEPPQEPPAASFNYEQDLSEGTVEVTISSITRLNSVRLDSTAGTVSSAFPEDPEVGDTATVSGLDGGDTVNVVGSHGGREDIIGTYTFKTRAQR
jgi:flagellin-like protein